jgi:DNA repair photolyase
MNKFAIHEVECKSALSSSKLPGLTYSLNPYKGCQHNCCYCYVPNVLRIERKNWGCFVDVKKNISLILSKELQKKKKGVVGVSTVTDPYQPIEKKYQLTRNCLKQLKKYEFAVCIQTKSSLILRDMDILKEFKNVEIFFSFSTINNKLQKILEPDASSVKERLRAVQICVDKTISTTVFFGPILPFMSEKDVKECITSFIDHGASKIMIDSLNVKAGMNENIKKNLVCDSKTYDLFVKNNENIANNYLKIKKCIKKIGKEKNIEITDAF